MAVIESVEIASRDGIGYDSSNSLHSAYFAPGEMTTMFPHVGKSEGRVHFAGEHTSSLYVMEGAAQSGIRAVREINAAG